MNKKIIIGVLAIIALIVVGLILAGQRQEEEKETGLSLQKAKLVAQEWIVNNAPTYIYDGFDLEFVEGKEVESERTKIYELVFSFTSRAAGYGDRSDQVLAQVITPHTIEIIVTEDLTGRAMVASAITDGVFDETDQTLIRLPEDEIIYSEPITISLYFIEVVDGQEEFVPITREIPQTLAVARAAIEELLAGPSEQEKTMGLSSAIPEGTELLEINIEEGIARVDFSQELEEGVAGSAWVMAIRNQIEKTLMQFETVNEVIISVEGRTEDILQP